MITGRGKNIDFTKKEQTWHTKAKALGVAEYLERPTKREATYYASQTPERFDSAFFAPGFATTVPGKVRLTEGSPDVKVFNKRQSGDLIAQSHVQEELELRRQGKTPSSEFIREKRQRQKAKLE